LAVALKTRKVNKLLFHKYFMERDLEVLDYLVRNMEEAANRLEKTVNDHKIEESNKIKKTILELNGKINEEIK